MMSSVLLFTPIVCGRGIHMGMQWCSQNVAPLHVQVGTVSIALVETLETFGDPPVREPLRRDQGLCRQERGCETLSQLTKVALV